MLAASQAQMVTAHARDALYDIVLLAHVLTALVGFGALAVSGAYALALRASGPRTETVRRYYRPGINWAGRILYAVPILGFVLLGMSDGDWSTSDGWVAAGLLLWAAVALGAEMALWPTERRLQAAVSTAVPAELEAVGGPHPSPTGPDRLSTTDRTSCLLVAGMALVGDVLLVVATVVMVAKP